MKRSELKRSAPIARKPAAAKEAKPGKGARPKKCAVKGCRKPFTPARAFESWCSPECGALVALERIAKEKAKAARADRADTKKKLEQHKPLEYWLKKAESACNEYIRARYPDVCISCGVTYSSAWQAGHYISVGANRTLRYNEDNIHKQCIQCNMHKASNATEYRLRLIEKIGLERVEYLESWHSPVKMTRAAAEEIEAHYKLKLKQLKEQAA